MLLAVITRETFIWSDISG